MTHETAGDPVSGLKWTRRTTAKLADELRGLGIHVCPQTVARLLKAMGYSLRVNHKKLAGASHPNRDRQFRHITDLRERLCRRQQPPHQRRYEEEGARRHVPQSRRQVGPQPRTRQRPRLPLRRRRPRRPLRHLRPPRQCRHRLRRQNRRHPGVRRRLHREVVAHRGPQALPRSQNPADPGRRRRQQQLHGARLEVQPATSPLQPARFAGDGSSLPAGHVEVEPHRTPPVLRDQQELGGPTPRQLRDHPEVPAHHTHLHRTEGPRPPGAEDLRDRRQGHRRPNARAAHHTEQRHAQVELHHRTHVTKTESILASTLRCCPASSCRRAPRPRTRSTRVCARTGRASPATPAGGEPEPPDPEFS